MKLNEKLSSLSSKDTVAELNSMLDRAHVSVNWYGQRVVSIEGYEDFVTINELSIKYLKAEPFKRDNSSSLKERLDCYALWGRVQQLYTDSDKVISETYLYKYITPSLEFRPYCRACAGDPMAVIGEWDVGATKDTIFEFTPDEFKKLWPNATPVGKSWVGGESSERWTATKEMVDAAAANP